MPVVSGNEFPTAEDVETGPDLTTMVAALDRVAAVMNGGHGVADVLVAMATGLVDLLGLAGAGVSTCCEDSLTFAACAPDRLADLERAQQIHRQGPGVAAVAACTQVGVEDLSAHRGEWPEYVSVAAALDIHAVLAVPVGGPPALGTVDLYVDRPHVWSRAETGVVDVFVAIVAAYLRNTAALDDQRRISDQLQHALISRVTIEQAKGMVAARHGVTVEQAFDLLRKHANDHQARLHAVADAVVRLGLQV